MSLVFVILEVVSFLALAVGVVTLTRRVKQMDKDIHEAFGYVGDQIGGLLVRAHRVESQIPSFSEQTQPAEPEGVDVFVVLNDAEEWARSSARVTPAVLGVDWAEGVADGKNEQLKFDHWEGY